MSFGLGREDFTATRIRASLPSFLIVWLGIVLFLVFLSFFLKQQLQTSELRDVEDRLAAYLANNPVSDLMAISRQHKEVGTLQGLSFIRFVKTGEQILLAEDSSAQVDFHRLAGLDPKTSGVWISLQHPEKDGPWTITAKTLPGGLSIQAGKETGQYGLLYDRIVPLCRLAALGGGLLALALALACVQRSVAPIRKVGAEIAAILADGRLLLPEEQADKELTDLYCQLNRLLRHNRQLIAEMQASLDNVAHDLRTPMTRLRAVAEYGLQADADADRLRDALSDCLEESERVLSMLRIMMSVAEAESGTMHLHKEKVELDASLADIVSLYEYVAEEKKIAVRWDLEPGLWILADQTRIAQVWANLLDNAIKYGKENGEVVISSRHEGEYVVIVFADDGMGISKNEIPRIWERLYRGDRSRTQPGLGLGLNYVRAVVEAHGGTVSVESELQKGTRFRMRLPHLQPESESIMLRSQIKGA
jgi:signal transduction histidine kinase